MSPNQNSFVINSVDDALFYPSDDAQIRTIDGLHLDDDFLVKQAAILRSIEEDLLKRTQDFQSEERYEDQNALKVPSNRSVVSPYLSNVALLDEGSTQVLPPSSFNDSNHQCHNDKDTDFPSKLLQVHHNPDSKDPLKDIYNDHVTYIGSQRVRVKGTKQAHLAIANGDATLVGCSACGAVLQVPRTTKNLFCTLCHHITSMEVATLCVRQGIDQHIATSMQQQEFHVAQARSKIIKQDM
jgi:LSD1 subclass zinc finger protein